MGPKNFTDRIAEQFLKEVCNEEINYFIRKMKAFHPKNKRNGYRAWNVMSALGILFSLYLPRCRYGEKELEFSLLGKNSRYTNDTLNQLEELYKSDNFPSFLCRIIKKTKLPNENKKKIEKEVSKNVRGSNYNKTNCFWNC